MRLDQRLPGAFVNLIDGQQSFRRRDFSFGIGLNFEYAFGYRSGESCDALALFPEPTIERWVEPDQIIEECGLEKLQCLRMRHGCSVEQAGVNPEPIVEQHQMITIRP